MADFTVVRKKDTEVVDVPKVDGQLIFETNKGINNKIYLDQYDENSQEEDNIERIVIGGGAGDYKPNFIGELTVFHQDCTADPVDSKEDDVAFSIMNEEGNKTLKIGWDGMIRTKDLDGNYISIIDVIYPIGSIYMSVNNISPKVLFGGNWEQIKDRFLIASGEQNESGAIGGTYSHTLTKAELPIHNHQISHTHTINGFYTDDLSGYNGYHVHSVKGTGNTTTNGNHEHELFASQRYDLHKDSQGHPTSTGAGWGVGGTESTDYTNAWITSPIRQTGDHSHIVSILGDTKAESISNPNGVNGEHKHHIPTHNTSTQSAEFSSNSGEGKPFDIVPPYLAVNMWKRIG